MPTAINPIGLFRNLIGLNGSTFCFHSTCMAELGGGLLAVD